MIVGQVDVIGMDGDVGEAAGAELLLEIGCELGHAAAALHGGDRDRMLVNLPCPGVPGVGRRLRDRRGGGGEQGGGDEGMAHGGDSLKAAGDWRIFGAGQAASPWPRAR